MSDIDQQQEDAGTPATEQQPGAAPEQPATAPDEARNPEQYLHWSRRSRDPDDIEHR